MTTHRLKTAPQYFDATWGGEKPYEVRWDDRGYQRGDTVVLEEHDPRITCRCVTPDRTHGPDCDKYSGRWIEATVGHVASSTPPRGRQPGFRGNGYVVFALLDLVHSDDEIVASLPPVPAGHSRSAAQRVLGAVAACASSVTVDVGAAGGAPSPRRRRPAPFEQLRGPADAARRVHVRERVMMHEDRIREAAEQRAFEAQFTTERRDDRLPSVQLALAYLIGAAAWVQFCASPALVIALWRWAL